MARTRARYTAALRISGPLTGAAFATLVAGSTKAISVREIGLQLVAATASSVGLIRAATNGTATTSTAGQPYDTNAAAAQGSIKSAWSAAGTIGSVYLRRVILPATAGGSLSWEFDEDAPLIIQPAAGLTLWNFGGGTASDVDLFMSWDEGI